MTTKTRDFFSTSAEAEAYVRGAGAEETLVGVYYEEVDSSTGSYNFGVWFGSKANAFSEVEVTHTNDINCLHPVSIERQQINGEYTGALVETYMADGKTFTVVSPDLGIIDTSKVEFDESAKRFILSFLAHKTEEVLNIKLDMSDFVMTDGDKVLSTNDFTDKLKELLESIERDAQKNVQSSFTETNEDSDAFIKNVPDYLKRTPNDPKAPVKTNDDGKIPVSMVEGLALESFAGREEFQELSDEVSKKASKESLNKLKDDLESTLDGGLVTHDEIFTAGASEKIPASNIQGLVAFMQQSNSGLTSTQLDELIAEKVEEGIEEQASSPDRTLTPKTGVIYMEQDGKWHAVDATLEVRFTDDNEKFEVRYRKNWYYPDVIDFEYNFTVTSDGKHYGGKERHGYAPDKDYLSDWWGHPFFGFFDHNEFESDEAINVRVYMRPRGYDDDPDGDGFTTQAPQKRYVLHGQRFKEERATIATSSEDSGMYRWEVTFTIDGDTLTTNEDFDENEESAS